MLITALNNKIICIRGVELQPLLPIPLPVYPLFPFRSLSILQGSAKTLPFPWNLYWFQLPSEISLVHLHIYYGICNSSLTIPWWKRPYLELHMIETQAFIKWIHEQRALIELVRALKPFSCLTLIVSHYWQSAVPIHNRSSQNKDTNYTQQHTFSVAHIRNLCSWGTSDYLFSDRMVVL